MSNHVPLEAGGTLRDFDFGFLNFAFAKYLETGIGGLANQVSRLPFTHRKQQDARGGASGACAGGFDSATNQLVILGETHGGELRNSVAKLKRVNEPANEEKNF